MRFPFINPRRQQAGKRGVKFLLRRLRLAALKPRLSRKRKTQLLYFVLGFCIIGVSFLCVGVSAMLFRAGEDRLFDGDHYMAVNIVAAEDIGRPLPLTVRLGLYELARKGTVGTARIPYRDELSEAAALMQAGSLWEAIVQGHLPKGETSFSFGNTPAELNARVQYRSVLRDFYAADSGAALSLWIVQVYADNARRETVCLSVLLDSRTGDPYYVEFAGFDAVSRDSVTAGLSALCGSFGVTDLDLSRADIHTGEDRATVTIRLTDEISIKKTCVFGKTCIFELVFA